MTEKEERFSLRLPASLKAELERMAAQNERSLNQEMVYALKQYMGKAAKR